MRKHRTVPESREEERESARNRCELADLAGKLRLFVPASLASGASVLPTPEQAHYLLRVMRAREGDLVRLFNGCDGEWSARIADATPRSCRLACEFQTSPQTEVPDVWLAFAPLKRTSADYVAQKATELGVRVLQPVFTRRTVAHRVNTKRMYANAVEAAEQSGRLTVPEVRAPLALDALLRCWPDGRRLVFCDEGGAPPIADALATARQASGRWSILTGPEGGFDASERAAIRKHAFTLPVSLGPRIMRADTAALAALAVWQTICGDWREGPLSAEHDVKPVEAPK